MNAEFEARHLNLHDLDPDLALFVKSNALRINGGEVLEEDLRLMSNIVKSAKKIAPIVCDFEENHGLEGFILAVSKKKTNENDRFYPVMFSHIGNAQNPGKYTRENDLKVLTLKENLEFTSSIQSIFPSKEDGVRFDENGVGVEGGALLFKDDWIISVSGFTKPHMNAAVTLGIAFGTKLIKYDEAIKRAREEGMECLDLFVNYADRLTGPFLTDFNSRDGIHEEPHLSI